MPTMVVWPVPVAFWQSLQQHWDTNRGAPVIS
jgi:hypothetical protein